MQQPVVDLPRRRQVAARARGGQVVHLPRHLVGAHRDHALAAERHQRERERVVPGEHLEARGPVVEDVHDLAEIARRLLDRGDVLVRGDPQQRLGVDVAARAPRHVVDHHRHRARIRDGGVVPVEAFGRRLVVVRPHAQDTHGAGRRGGLALLDRDPGVVRARAGQHRYAAARFLDRDLDDPELLLRGHRHRLSGGAARDEHVDAALDLPAHGAPQGRLVEIPRLREGRDERHARAGE